MTRWPPLPADVATMAGQMKGKTMTHRMPRQDAELPPRMPEAATIARLTADLQAVLRREEDANRAAFNHLRRAEAAVALLGAAYRAGRDDAAIKAEDHLQDWANDLASTRDSLIDAKTSGIWNGRKVRDKTWLTNECRRFGERAEAVAESADHTAAAIRALPTPADLAARLAKEAGE